MAGTDGLVFDRLGPGDIAGALALSAEAGWNQTAEDWALMMRHGHCTGYRDRDGRPVASALALPMGAGVGWISMVLVTADWRRRGLATRLVEDSARWLEDRGITPLLDATPDGAAVYRRMGFVGLCEIRRWQRAAGPREAPGAGVRPAGAGDLDAIAALDAAAFGAERRFVLADLMARGPALVNRSGGGFLLGRRGRLAMQIGPVTAADEATAVRLLRAALAGLDGPVFVDAFDARTGFAEALAAAGFSVQRPFTRMMRGEAARGLG
ncbi:GNAT family N-acetyltransferase, partial [Aquibium sp. A9E412]|uniref:GNAT family N-acetyltransferase n=1 Tax=Aquibium sp. A9E412 TaxID=2976767 RepID=UPI0025B195C6